MTKVIDDIVKVYPHMFKVVIYREPYALPPKIANLEKTKKHNFNSLRSIRRTKTIIKDIVLCNKFDYFCTFTFDRRKHNRYDINHCKLVMSMWLKRQRSHSPDLKYLIVPELHKDGAIHFHALIANYNGYLKPLNVKTKSGQPIYNISNYRAGKISSAVPINDNKDAVANYVIKQYVTKDMLNIFGKKRYWCSKNLERPKTYVNGVTHFGLSKIIRNVKADYEDEFVEVQNHQTQGSKLSKTDIMLDLPF